MRFFSLSKVKNDISSGAVSEQETFRYAIAWFIVFYVASFPAAGEGVSATSYVYWLVFFCCEYLGDDEKLCRQWWCKGSRLSR